MRSCVLRSPCVLHSLNLHRSTKPAFGLQCRHSRAAAVHLPVRKPLQTRQRHFAQQEQGIISNAAPDTTELYSAQLLLILRLLHSEQEPLSNLRLTLFIRERTSFQNQQITLQQACTVGASSDSGLEGSVLQLGSSRGEPALSAKSIIELPTGSLILPLSTHGHVLGILVADADPAHQAPHAELLRLPGAMQPDVVLAEPLFGQESRSHLVLGTHALTLSLALELQASLQHSQRATVQRLADEARGPVAALRTLVSMLQTRMKPGTVERDLVAAADVQGRQMDVLVQQLQVALAPPGAQPAPLLHDGLEEAPEEQQPARIPQQAEQLP